MYNNIVFLSVKRSISNAFLYLMLIASMIYGGGIIISIYLYNGNFTNRNLIGVYGTLSLFVMEIFCILNIVIDNHYGTFAFAFDNKKKRIRYFISQFLNTGVISLLFSLGGIVLLFLNNIINHIAIDHTMIIMIPLQYCIYGLFYMVSFFLISMFCRNTINVLVIFFSVLMVVPGILSIMANFDAFPNWMRVLVGLIPIYSLPTFVSMLDLTLEQIAATIICIVLIVSYILYKLPKMDY